MRLHQILPKAEPHRFECPKECQRKGCPGKRVPLRREAGKKIMRAQNPQTTAWRFECKKCGRVFRIYLQGIRHFLLLNTYQEARNEMRARRKDLQFFPADARIKLMQIIRAYQID